MKDLQQQVATSAGSVSDLQKLRTAEGATNNNIIDRLKANLTGQNTKVKDLTDLTGRQGTQLQDLGAILDRTKGKLTASRDKVTGLTGDLAASADKVRGLTGDIGNLQSARLKERLVAGGLLAGTGAEATGLTDFIPDEQYQQQAIG